MKSRRVTNLRLALLLALLLPLQSLAALANCGQGAIHAAIQQAPVGLGGLDSHCEHAPANLTHHDCGSCCCVAAAGNSLQNWAAPPAAGPPPTPTRIHSAPSVAIDRLDRPPRTHRT